MLFATAALAVILIEDSNDRNWSLALVVQSTETTEALMYELTLIKSKCVKPLVTTLQSRVQDQVHVLPAPLTLLLKTAEMS